MSMKTGINGGGPAFLEYSGLLGDAAWSFTADVNEADAKTAAVAIEAQWQRWQITYAFSGGTAKTATLKPHYQDAEGEWHKLGALSLKDTFAAGDVESQLTDIIAPAGALALAMELADSVTIGTLTVKVRGVKG